MSETKIYTVLWRINIVVLDMRCNEIRYVTLHYFVDLLIFSTDIEN